MVRLLPSSLFPLPSFFLTLFSHGVASSFVSTSLAPSIVTSMSDSFGADIRYYYEKKFDECRGVIQPEMALPMGIPGAFGLPVSKTCLQTWRSNLRSSVKDRQRGKLRGVETDEADIPILVGLVC